MRTLSIFLLFVALLGCAHRTGEDFQTALTRSLPRDASVPLTDGGQGFQHSLIAEGSDWTVTVQWNSGELKRFVTWRQSDDGFSLGIPLRKRSEPYTYSRDGMTITRFGPYQPACVHRRNRVAWHVMMSHEQADFPTEEHLRKMLEMFFPGRAHAQPVLSPEGIMVTFRGPLYSHSDTLDVEIWMLTVAGEKPRPELLGPFLTGKVSIETKQNINGAS